MYKYKLNNSYTVYVNWSYYSECAKICKDAHKKEKRANSTISKKPAITAAPLPRGTKVSSKAFGVGTILSTSKDGITDMPYIDTHICPVLWLRSSASTSTFWIAERLKSQSETSKKN